MIKQQINFVKIGMGRYISTPFSLLKSAEPNLTFKAFKFTVGDTVKVTSYSKGKGFSGTIKKGHSRGAMSHGSGHHRSLGSIGSIAGNRVFKALTMPGRLGHDRCTVRSTILKMSFNNGVLYVAVQGSIPGPKKGIVWINEN